MILMFQFENIEIYMYNVYMYDIVGWVACVRISHYIFVDLAEFEVLALAIVR